MRKISANRIFIEKWLYPAFWFGYLFFLAYNFISDPEGVQTPLSYVILAVLAVAGYFFFKRMVWQLADSVTDFGDYLVVRRGALEETVYLSSIVNISSSEWSAPAFITLNLRAPGSFGSKVEFIPVKNSLNPFAGSAVYEELIVRIDKARTQKAG